MKKATIKWPTLSAIAIASLPLLYLAIIWKNVPDIVFTHFNLRMEPDATGSKDQLWMPAILLGVVSVSVYFVFRNISRIDPKRKTATGQSTFNRLAFILVVFLSFLNFVLILSGTGHVALFSRLLYPLIGLMLAVIGNYLHTIKPNYFIGLRLPWTLENPVNWQRTHMLAGKLWVAGGLLIAIVSIFVSPKAATIIMGSIIAVITLIPVIYSFRLFRAGNPPAPDHQS